MKFADEIERGWYDALALNGTFFQKSGLNGSHDLARMDETVKARREVQQHVKEIVPFKQQISSIE